MYTHELTKIAELKNKAHNIAKSSNSETDQRVFRNIRNKYNNLVKDTKSKYFSQKLTIRGKKIQITAQTTTATTNKTIVITALIMAPIY